MTSEEDFVLIDLGSISKRGTVGVATTLSYLPSDIRNQSRHKASPELDWWMFGVMLAEKCCGPRGIAIGTGASDILSKELLINHLKDHLLSSQVFEEWKEKVQVE